MKLIPNHIKNLITIDILKAFRDNLAELCKLKKEELTYCYILERDILTLPFYSAFEKACLDNNKGGFGTGLIRYYNKLPCCSFDSDSNFDADGFRDEFVNLMYKNNLIEMGTYSDDFYKRYPIEEYLTEGVDYIKKPVRIADGVLRIDIEYLGFDF